VNNLIEARDRFFVAGARGMAGSAICRALQEKGYGDEAKGGTLLTPSRQELNLLNHEEVERWYEEHKPTVVVLAAAKVGGIYANDTYPADFLLENLKIQTNVIEGAWKAGVRRLLFLGSSCIYPKHAEQPIVEESLLTGPLESTNQWYAIAKISGIKLCESLRIQYDFDAICLMPTNLYGPGDNYHLDNCHVLPALLRKFHEAKKSGANTVQCWGTGKPCREFLHANDLGEACVHVLESWSALDENSPKDLNGIKLSFLNVGIGKDLSIKELSRKIANLVNYDGEVIWDNAKPDGSPKKLLDNKRLSDLGWRARISLETGLKSTYEDFLQKHK
jgi:GDP-L-fucose synthase